MREAIGFVLAVLCARAVGAESVNDCAVPVFSASMMQSKRTTLLKQSAPQQAPTSSPTKPWLFEGPAHTSPHNYVVRIRSSSPETILPENFRPDQLLAPSSVGLVLTLSTVMILLALALREPKATGLEGYQRKSWEEGRLSVWDGTVATFSGVVGVGILSMPYACSRAGLVAAPLILFVVGCSAFTAHLLVWSFEALQQRSPLAGGLRPLGDEGMSGSSPFDSRAVDAEASKHYSWGALMEAAFGPRAQVATNVFICLETWGYLLSYIVGASMNISQFIGDPKSQHLTGILISVVFAVALSRQPLRLLANANILSNLVNFMCLVMILVSGLSQPEKPSLSELRLFDAHGLFSVAGLLVFSPAAHAFFPDLQRRLQYPKRFCCCLRRAYSGAAVLYLLVAVCGYILLGDAAQPSAIQNVGWTRDFKPLPNLHWMAVASAAGMAVRLLIMQAFVLPTLCSSLQGLTSCPANLQGALTTCILTVSAGVAALFAKQVALLLNLIGCGICANIAFTLPAACYWQLSRQSRRLPLYEKAGLAGLLCMGGSFSILGTISFVRSQHLQQMG